MTFKLRERQDARRKRLAEEGMPPSLTTTVAGVDYFLQEIRGVIKGEQDIKELWPGKDVDRMKILTLDGGQASVVGAFVHLPNGLTETYNGKEKAEEGSSMDGIITINQESTSLASQGSATLDPVPASASTLTSIQAPATDSLVTPSKPAYYNLAVKQKAVYRPTFRFRRWLENEKMTIPQGEEEESITYIATHLPLHRGPCASVVEYMR
ncbi:hypothetical protein KI688_011921 [Linnemannia hyalina]|uniref:Uncharacterized protein n=1 Tax=Linnemannia hyalina TaxID=64524 RepID=A0A9P7XTM9_9FUNG|nr:hypothetical protein KI688_011921 [Linnemannia hyalina]